MRNAEGSGGDFDRFAVVDAAFAHLAGGHTVHVGQKRTQEQSRCAGTAEEQGEHGDVSCVVQSVEPADGLAQGADAVGERKERIDRLEKSRGHLYRVQAGRARDLGEHQHDAQAFAHMLQRDGQRVDDAEVRKRSDRRGEEERGRVRGRYADDEDSRTADDCLQDGEHREERQPRQIALRERDAGDAFVVHFLLQDDEQHERADPEGQVHEQGSHGRTVRADGIKLLGHHARGRADERCDLLGVQAAVAEELVQGGRALQRLQVGADGVEVVFEILEQGICPAQGVDGRAEGAGKFVQQERRLVGERLLACDGA